MAYLAGEPITDVLTLRDTAGAVVTGATWSTLYSRHQNGTTLTTTVEETASPGTYLISTETLQAGSVHRILTATKGTPGTSGYFFNAFASTAHVVSRGSPFEHYAGQAIEEVVYLVDASGTPLTGVTFETDSQTTYGPNGWPFTVTATAITGVAGGYLLAFTPDLTGVWTAELVTDTSPERRFRFEAVVFPSGLAVTGSPLAGSGQVTWQRIDTWRGTVTWQRLT
jgi:hypothetical protein